MAKHLAIRAATNGFIVELREEWSEGPGIAAINVERWVAADGRSLGDLIAKLAGQMVTPTSNVEAQP